MQTKCIKRMFKFSPYKHHDHITISHPEAPLSKQNHQLQKRPNPLNSNQHQSKCITPSITRSDPGQFSKRKASRCSRRCDWINSPFPGDDPIRTIRPGQDQRTTKHTKSGWNVPTCWCELRGQSPLASSSSWPPPWCRGSVPPRWCSSPFAIRPRCRLRKLIPLFSSLDWVSLWSVVLGFLDFFGRVSLVGRYWREEDRPRFCRVFIRVLMVLECRLVDVVV